MIRKRIKHISLTIATVLVLVVSCAPSERVIQTAIDETQSVYTEVPTLTPYPTYTPIPYLSPGPRTFYESLDLSSPESAIQTFIDAFSRDDFPTVWLILDRSAQFVWLQRITVFEYDDLIQTDNWEEMKMDITTFAKGLNEGERSEAHTSYTFDQFMLAARRHSAFRIDLTGSFEILSSEPSITIQDNQSIDVVVRMEKLEGEVIFRMVQAPSGRWRVYKVFVPGGEGVKSPWGIPHEVD